MADFRQATQRIWNRVGQREDGPEAKWPPMSEVVLSLLVLLPYVALAWSVYREPAESRYAMAGPVGAPILLIYLIAGQAQIVRRQGILWSLAPLLAALVAVVPVFQGILTPSEAAFSALICVLTLDGVLKFRALTPPWWLRLRVPVIFAGLAAMIVL